MNTIAATIVETIKILIIFLGFTLLFYYGIVWLNEEYEGYHRYDKPQGGAVKVMKYNQLENSEDSLNRLYFFYHYGE
jgi:hypothetical protein